MYNIITHITYHILSDPSVMCMLYVMLCTLYVMYTLYYMLCIPNPYLATRQ